MAHCIEVTTLIPHGVVFIYDPTMIIEVPPDTAAAAVLSTGNCVSLWTVQDVDGPTTLVLTDAFAGDDCQLVFQGTLEATGRRLAFNTSGCESIIELDVGTDAPEVAIYANDATEPSKVVCVTATI